MKKPVKKRSMNILVLTKICTSSIFSYQINLSEMMAFFVGLMANIRYPDAWQNIQLQIKVIKNEIVVLCYLVV